MLNAYQACNIATAAAKDQIERRFKFIMNRIEAAASEGKYYCGFNEPLQEELAERLQDLGYEVNMNTYTIGWRNK